MSGITTYKNPPAEFMNIVSENMATIGEYVRHRHKAKEAMETILDAAKRYNVPDAQLRQILQNEWNKMQLSQRTFLLYLPKQLKNQNMVRQRPKKEPLVNKWKVKFNIPQMWDALKPLKEAGHKEGYIVHDNNKVLDVEYR